MIRLFLAATRFCGLGIFSSPARKTSMLARAFHTLGKNGCLALLTWSDELNRHSFIAGST
jgi:hypothetical protein